ncbi:hypothetical protein BB561_001415 [Smittium simulii]|uniref:Pre-mRNA-splicing factor SYF1 n=1 Tax=Smittium simulii TaxID=133385 RepID=A0A2T9YUQ4_9FUNG|nr:hypothetical protein BB561_001415 [Smittium simulii]
MFSDSASNNNNLINQDYSAKLKNQEISLNDLIDDSDLPFEQDVQSDPYNLRNWLQYIEHKTTKNQNTAVILLFERAVKALPGSFKLWKRFLEIRKSDVTTLEYVSNQEEYNRVNGLFERAILLLHKMPRIWLNYLDFLMMQPKVTITRRVFDRALRALAVTQHDRIWKIYIDFAHKIGGVTEEKVLTRYISIFPEKSDILIKAFKKHKKYSSAAKKIIDCLNDPSFDKIYNTSRYKYWLKLAKFITDYPQDMADLNVEAILRQGIGRYKDLSANLWISLAGFYIANQNFEKARDIYEDAIEQIVTVRDFTLVFDSYSMFEENLLTGTMENAANNSGNNQDISLIDLRIARFEILINRRPFLVSDVVLRQNPNLVEEWIKRVDLYKNKSDIPSAIETYENAIKNISPRKAIGELSDLWINYAEHYESTNDQAGYRSVFERATQVNFKTVAELAKIWCTYAEMEIRNNCFDEAESVLVQAITPPGPHSLKNNVNYHDEHTPPQKRVFKSLSIWQMYIDLEESSDNTSKTRAAYDRIIELRIATPQIIVNYTNFLKEHCYFEEVFRVYEKGISLFGYPVAFELWNLYLAFFVERYKGTKIERARDLFEQALTGCPGNLSKPIFIMFGQFEEDFGQIKNALLIYQRACKSVTKDKLQMYQLYISKTSSLLGDNMTRKIYEEAVSDLVDEQDTLLLLIDFARMELKLGEIDRARALYGYASQFADPRVNSSFWDMWHSFEVECGNEDTFKEMLRIKRTIQTRFNTDISFLSAQLISQKKQKEQENVNNSGIAGSAVTFTKGALENSLEKVTIDADSSATNLDNNPDEISGLDFDI